MKHHVRILTIGLVVALSFVLALSSATQAESKASITAKTASDSCIYIEPDTLFFNFDLCDSLPYTNLDSSFFYIHDCGDTGLFWNVTADQGWVITQPSSGYDTSPVMVFIDLSAVPDIFTPPLPGDTLFFYSTVTVDFPNTIIPPRYMVVSLAFTCGHQPEPYLVVEPNFVEHFLPPDSMLVGYINVDDNIINKNYAVSYQTMASWINLPETFAQVYTPTTLEYTVNSYNLSPGMYVDTIAIYMYDSLSSELIDSDGVQVVLFVDSMVGGYDLQLFPHQVEVTIPEGGSPNNPYGHIHLYEASSQTLFVDFGYYSNWLSVTYEFPPLTTPDSVRYEIDPTGLAPGIYVDTITFVARTEEGGEPVDFEGTQITLVVEDQSDLVVMPESFVYTVNPGDYIADTMYISTRSGDTLRLNFSNNYSWLSLPVFFTPPTTPTNLWFNISTDSLPPGRYYDQITITAYNLNNELVDEVIVPVRMQILDNGTYTIETDKDHLYFVADGNLPTYDSIYVYETGGASIPFYYEESAPWMIVGPADPATPSYTPAWLYVVINTGNFPPGYYTDTLKIFNFNYDTGDTTIKRIPVDLTILNPDTTKATVVAEPLFYEFTATPGTFINHIPVNIYEISGKVLPYNVDIRKGDWLFWSNLLTVIHTTPDSTFFEIHVGDLAPGVYYDSAVIYKPTDDLPTYDDVYIHFTLNVLEDTTQYFVDLVTEPRELVFDLDWGEYRCDSLFIYETNGYPVPFTFSNSKGWLNLDPLGIYPYVTPTSIMACAFADDTLLPGVYYDTITIRPYPNSDTLFAPYYVPVRMYIHYPNQQPLGDSLIISSVNIPGCDNNCYKLSVYTQLSQTIRGANIPFEIPAGVEICSLSTAGLYTENWDKTVFTLDKKEGYFQTALVNSSGYSIPPGLTEVFDVYFTLNDCYDGQTILWDTTFSDIDNRSLAFVDTTYNLLRPGYDKYRNQTTVSTCVPGDFDGDGFSDVGDLVNLIDFMFTLKLTGNKIYPINPRAFDFNKDCFGPDIADLVYMVDYMFVYPYLPYECGCIGDTVYFKAVNQNYQLLTRFENGHTIISLNAPTNVRGINLDLSGFNGKTIENLTGDKLDLITDSYESQVVVGLFDRDGNNVIASGNNDLLQIEGEVTLERAVLADDNYTAIYPSLGKGSILPDGFELSQNYPNPFNPSTEIKFSIPETGLVVLEIYNINGQLVKTLANGQFDAGQHTLEWDGRDNNGQTVASGIYLYRLENNGHSQSKKMMLLK